MYRQFSALLCAVVMVMMIAAGCISFGAPPLVTPQTTIAATTVPSAPVVTAASQPGAAGTQAPGTCAADVSSDAANCGGCGYACPANALCQQGQCYCKDGFTAENNHCVLAPAGTSSDNGCPAGMSACPDGYCYELASSTTNCGMCGNVCPAGMVCIASTCTNVPTETTTTAVTTETTTTTTTSSPGLGFTVKPGGYKLSCVVLGLTNCGGTCVNLTTSNGNCGTCGNICSGLTATCCKGTCTSLKTDTSNCGTCGHKCNAFSTCSAGSCTAKVVTGVTLVKVPLTYAIVNPIYQNPVNPGI